MSVGEVWSTYSANCQALWHLNGSSADSSGNSHTGTDTAITYSNANGRFNNGAGFNGSTSSIATATNIGISGSSNRTTMCWFKVNTLANSTMLFWGAATANNDWRHNVNSNVLTLDINGTSLAGNTNINDGAWHHTAIVNSGTALTFYVDGAVDKTGTLAGLNTTDGVVYIGSVSGSSSFTNGYLDEAAIFARAWSANEIIKYYAWAKGFYR